MMCFNGSIPKIDKENELTAWNLIKDTVQKAIDKYPNTLQEDTEILEKDDKDHNLNFN